MRAIDVVRDVALFVLGTASAALLFFGYIIIVTYLAERIAS